ncbi:MAG: hypothetical protein COA78_13965 [Blastopirellula sp.]|nr:MAG: hypothetical protein COA78_13965 [Blastopirellula sp.]
MAKPPKPMTRRGSIFAIVIGGAMIIMVAAMAFPCVRMQWFRSVQGTVLSTKDEVIVSPKRNLHKPVIKYSYIVDGIAYNNDVYDPFKENGLELWALRIVYKYRVGGPCTVYYDPSNPNYSVLSNQPSTETVWSWVGIFFFGPLLVIIGVIALRSGNATQETSQPEPPSTSSLDS